MYEEKRKPSDNAKQIADAKETLKQSRTAENRRPTMLQSRSRRRLWHSKKLEEVGIRVRRRTEIRSMPLQELPRPRLVKRHGKGQLLNALPHLHQTPRPRYHKPLLNHPPPCANLKRTKCDSRRRAAERQMDERTRLLNVRHNLMARRNGSPNKAAQYSNQNRSMSQTSNSHRRRQLLTLASKQKKH